MVEAVSIEELSVLLFERAPEQGLVDIGRLVRVDLEPRRGDR